jgi:hypothetical protein
LTVSVVSALLGYFGVQFVYRYRVYRRSKKL